MIYEMKIRTLPSEPTIPAILKSVEDLTDEKIDEVNRELSCLADLGLQQRMAENIDDLTRQQLQSFAVL